MMSVVPSDTANATKTFRLWRARNGQSRRSQLVFLSSRARRGGAPRARRSERRSSRPAASAVSAPDTAVGSSMRASTSSSRARITPRRRTALHDRRAVTVSVVTRRSSRAVARSTSPRSTSVSTVAETVGLASASWPARSAGPVGTAADHGQEPVLRKGQRGLELATRTFEQPGEAGQGQEVVVHTGSVPNSSWSYLCKKFVMSAVPATTVTRQAGIHCGVTDP